MAIALPKMKKKKKICFGNCSSVIAENGKKKLFWQLWQFHCQKWKKKSFGNCSNDITENGGKKKEDVTKSMKE